MVGGESVPKVGIIKKSSFSQITFIWEKVYVHLNRTRMKLKTGYVRKCAAAPLHKTRKIFFNIWRNEL
jgi:hypothetical protein